MLGLTQAGAAKMVFHGVRVNAVSPSATATVRRCAASRIVDVKHGLFVGFRVCKCAACLLMGL